MRESFGNLKALCCLLAGGLLSVGCTDNKYDLGNLDKTMALGSGQLELPVKNSIKDILLDDILKIKDSESVTKDQDGYYHYEQSSTIDDVNNVRVDKIILAKAGNPIENPVLLSVADFPAGTPDGTEAYYTSGAISDKIETFNYTSAAQSQVVDLSSASLQGEMTLTVYFSSKLRAVVETIDEMDIVLPPYLDFEVLQMSDNAVRSGNTITFTNQKTDNQALVKINATGLDFAASKNGNAVNSIKFDPTAKTISMKGLVSVNATISKVKKRTIADDGYASAAIRSTLVMGDLTVNSAVGKFDPDITVNNSRIALNDLPDFLTNENVVVDLYNPQIILNATSQLPMPGTVDITLNAKKDNAVIKTIQVNNVKIGQAQQNKICISRRDENIPEGYDKYIVENLSQIIEKVPDVIEVQITAKADSENDYTIELGHDYSLTGINYSIKAPLAFGEKATVIYSDYVDGWAADMPKDLDLEDGAYIEVTANMDSNVPMNLTMKVKGVNVNKEEIENVKAVVDKDIAGSSDGKVVTTPIKVRIDRDKTKGSLKELDGIHFTLEAASDATLQGKTLNANENKLTARDIRVVIYGRVIADLN